MHVQVDSDEQCTMMAIRKAQHNALQEALDPGSNLALQIKQDTNTQLS